MHALRPATGNDAEAVAAIYAHHVLHGTGTFDEEPLPAAAFARRIAEVSGRGWPWLVVEDAAGVAGYAFATQFRDRAGYRRSCEDSIYVRHDAIGRGIGDALLGRLIAEVEARGFLQMFAVIGDSANAASIALHARHGFERVGLLREAGWKFGRPIDVVYMQKALTPA